MTLKFTRDWTHVNDKVENKKLQNASKTKPSNEKMLSTKRRVYERNQSCCLSFCHLSSPPPPPRRIKGTFASSPSPEPPSLFEKTLPFISVIGNLCFLQNHPLSRAFSGNLPKTNAPKVPHFLRKIGTRMRTLSEFEWGEGADCSQPPYVWNWVYSIKVLMLHSQWGMVV